MWLRVDFPSIDWTGYELVRLWVDLIPKQPTANSSKITKKRVYNLQLKSDSGLMYEKEAYFRSVLLQGRWKDWPSSRIQMDIGLKSWIQTIWPPYPNQFWCNLQTVQYQDMYLLIERALWSTFYCCSVDNAYNKWCIYNLYVYGFLCIL